MQEYCLNIQHWCAMARKSQPLQRPPFEPVSLPELRDFWVRYPEHDVRRLILEVERYRRLFKEVDTLYSTVHQFILDETGKHLVAAHLLRTAIAQERFRAPE